MTCQRVQLVREVGAPRGNLSADPPSICDVFGGFTCVNDTCAPMGDGSEGSPCDTSDNGDLIPCADGLYCDSMTATCLPMGGTGAACHQDRGCESGTCDMAAGTCAAQFCPAL